MILRDYKNKLLWRNVKRRATSHHTCPPAVIHTHLLPFPDPPLRPQKIQACMSVSKYYPLRRFHYFLATWSPAKYLPLRVYKKLDGYVSTIKLLWSFIGVKYICDKNLHIKISTNKILYKTLVILRNVWWFSYKCHVYCTCKKKKELSDKTYNRTQCYQRKNYTLQLSNPEYVCLFRSDTDAAMSLVSYLLEWFLVTSTPFSSIFCVYGKWMNNYNSDVSLAVDRKVHLGQLLRLLTLKK